MKTITIREAYDWLIVNPQSSEGLNEREHRELVQYIEKKYPVESVVELSFNKMRFINLVGVIQLSTVRIEILPKLSLDAGSEQKDRRALLNMLSVTRNLPVSLNEETLSKLEHVDLLHIFARMYIEQLTRELQKGIIKDYQQQQSNLLTLKGRLLVGENMKRNAFQPYKAYCEYDEHSEDNLLNQVLKKALMVINSYVRSHQLKSKIMMVLDLLKNVEDVEISGEQLDAVQFNRQNERFLPLFQLAIFILKSRSMASTFQKVSGFSLLFKVNDLYEGYIGEALKRVASREKFNVMEQHDEKRLLVNVHTNKANIKLKPDFVLTEKGQEPEVIIDTKWKMILYNDRVQYQQADLYQMYAYVTSYKEATRCILLYPHTVDASLPKWHIPDSNPAKYIEVRTVRLDSLISSLEDLNQLISIN